MSVAAQRPTLMILLGAVLLALATIAAATAGEPMVAIRGNHSSEAAEWISRAPGDRQLLIGVWFRMRNEAEMEKFGEEVNDPHSPKYHKWMKRDEYMARFAQPPAVVKAVRDWLSAQGFQIESADYMSISAWGTVATVEKAFAITIMTRPGYPLSYANPTDPQIPARFADLILEITGLRSGGIASGGRAIEPRHL